ncbi:MAG: lysozyme inhibitor LprI family protein [Rhizomicrobium sp.]
MKIVPVLAVALCALAPLPAAAASPKQVEACMAANDDAGRPQFSCIGMLYRDCTKQPNAEDAACAAGELAFWNAQLAAWSKQAFQAVAAYPELAKDQADAQKSWSAFRDKSCTIADKVDPGMMPGGSAYCRAQVTAERVFLLRQIGTALSEH